MKKTGEIEQLIGSLGKRGATRGIDPDRLKAILESVRADYSPLGDEERRLERIHGELRAGMSGMRSRHGRRIPLRFAYAFTLAAFCMFFLVMYGIISRHEPSHVAEQAVPSGQVIMSGHDMTREDNRIFSISEGDRLAVPDNESAEIRFSPDIRIFLPGSSEMVWMKSMQGSPGITVFLRSGSAAVSVNRLMKNQSMALVTSATRLEVRGTSFAVRINNDGTVRHEVYEGRVRISPRVPEGMIIDPAARRRLEGYFEQNGVDMEAGSVGVTVINPARIREILSALDRSSSPVLFTSVHAAMADEYQLDTIFPADMPQRKMKNLATDNGENDGIRPVEKSAVLSDYLLAWDGILLSIRGGKVVTAASPGGTLWNRILDDSVITQPVHVRNRIFLLTSLGRIYILDDSHGTPVGNVSPEKRILTEIPPVTDGEGVYVFLEDNEVMKLDRDGTTRWIRGLPGRPAGSAGWNDRLIFVPIDTGYIMGLDRRTGLMVMRIRGQQAPVSMIVDASSLFIGGSDGMVRCHSLLRDESQWNISLKGRGTPWFFKAGDGIVIVYPDGYGCRLSHNGVILREFRAGGPVMVPPVMDGEMVYVVSARVIEIFDTRAGGVAWSLVLKEPLSSGMVLAGREIVYLTPGAGIVSLHKQQ